MHSEWKLKKLATELNIGRIPRVEIDESKLIGNNEKVLYMFGIIDRNDKKCRVFFVLDKPYYLLLRIMSKMLWILKIMNIILMKIHIIIACQLEYTQTVGQHINLKILKN